MTVQMMMVLAVLGATVFLFVSEWLRVDMVALVVMVSLAWLGLVEPKEALSGLSSNAVVSIIGVMILGYGLDRTGVMNRVARPIIRMAGSSERRLLVLVSLSVGLISAFMQNIGAAALFLPALLRISQRLELDASRLLMPMGFAAILGGTLTMVASGPLIILNDLLRLGGQSPFGLFDVTPIGLALLLAGIGYFAAFGKLVLPRRGEQRAGGDEQRVLAETWELARTIGRLRVPANSRLIDRTVEQARLWRGYGLNLIALREDEALTCAPWRYTRFAEGQQLALLGHQKDVDRFAGEYGLEPSDEPDELLDELQQGTTGGFAEVVIRPRAPIAGKTLREVALRKNFGVEPLLRLSGGRDKERDFSDQALMPGDTLVVHGLWSRIRTVGDDPSFVLVTSVAEQQPDEASKALPAALCFVGAVGLAVAGFPLSISLLSGALAMILLRVMPIDAAYRAVDWRTVFLLAGLIPLGIAMDKSGTAAWVAQGITTLTHGMHPLLILTAVALLTTVFSLFMSNVAATVLLVPLVMLMGEASGIAPRALALLVAVCASNSFVLPTHQVNALLMSPGGYRNADYLRAGGVMTLLFVFVSVGLLYAFYLP